MGTLEIDAIKDYLISVGCKIEYPILVNAFKKHLYNPDPNIQSHVRTQFKDFVNRLSTVSLENNMKFINLRPEFRPAEPSGSMVSKTNGQRQAVPVANHQQHSPPSSNHINGQHNNNNNNNKKPQQLPMVPVPAEPVKPRLTPPKQQHRLQQQQQVLHSTPLRHDQLDSPRLLPQNLASPPFHMPPLPNQPPPPLPNHLNLNQSHQQKSRQMPSQAPPLPPPPIPQHQQQQQKPIISDYQQQRQQPQAVVNNDQSIHNHHSHHQMRANNSRINQDNNQHYNQAMISGEPVGQYHSRSQSQPLPKQAHSLHYQQSQLQHQYNRVPQSPINSSVNKQQQLNLHHHQDKSDDSAFLMPPPPPPPPLQVVPQQQQQLGSPQRTLREQMANQRIDTPTVNRQFNANNNSNQIPTPRPPPRRRQSTASLFKPSPAKPIEKMSRDTNDLTRKSLAGRVKEHALRFQSSASTNDLSALMMPKRNASMKENRLSRESVFSGLTSGLQRNGSQLTNRSRSSHRGEDESDSSSLQPIDPLRRKWAIDACNCNYNNLVSLLREDPKLASCKDIVNGYTALHWAAKFGNLDIIKLIAGTQRVPVNTKSSAGYTPLHIAYMFNRLEAAQLLTNSYQASTDIRDHSGKKPKQYLR